MFSRQTESLRRTEFLRTAEFRAALLGAALFTATTLLLFAFLYWQFTDFVITRNDSFLRHEAMAIAREQPSEIPLDIARRYAPDLHRITFVSVFAPDGRRLAGDLVARPAVPDDGQAHAALVTRIGPDGGIIHQECRLVLHVLPGGTMLVVGRDTAELQDMQAMVRRTLGIGLVPTLILALGAAIIASRRALRRLRHTSRIVQRIMDGALQERLPTGPGKDALNQLSASVNRMLDEIERLLGEARAAGDNIAHDLRTPLTRLRSRLEGGRLRAASLGELEEVVDRGIQDLDSCLKVITALLRISALEAEHRRSGFRPTRLEAILREVCELYLPLAEERDQTLTLRIEASPEIAADGELLFEAVANLVDNAIKFAPRGGQIIVALEAAPVPAITVTDSGAGIAEHERAAVLTRFYRADPSRHIEGSGLGLNLVSAILRLHGFVLDMRASAAGFTVAILCGAGRSGGSLYP